MYVRGTWFRSGTPGGVVISNVNGARRDAFELQAGDRGKFRDMRAPKVASPVTLDLALTREQSLS
jgi:hypothetical protein